MPWTMNVVSESMRMLISCLLGIGAPFGWRASCRYSLDLLDRSARGLVERDGAVCGVDAVLLEDLEALLLPGAWDPEDGDLLGGVHAQLQARLDHATRDDVNASVGHDRHHHRDLVHAWLLQHQLGQAAGLGDGRVAADLAVVGGLAPVGSDCVEEGARAA